MAWRGGVGVGACHAYSNVPLTARIRIIYTVQFHLHCYSHSKVPFVMEKEEKSPRFNVATNLSIKLPLGRVTVPCYPCTIIM